VRVGANVWLGGQSAVLKGVTIGKNSMVAFRAVVAGPVPSNVVVAGNPARDRQAPARSGAGHVNRAFCLRV
jgi:maltose O-acetyltransferase